jgi:hypothetical protein
VRPVCLKISGDLISAGGSNLSGNKERRPLAVVEEAGGGAR